MNQSLSKSYFVRQLLEWFTVNRRDLPWRKNKNPYHIWVSEIMLQQTQVKTVIPYFERFIASFPTIEALAEAPEEEVLKHWEGLGYYSRARNLHTAVREVKASYNGVVPREPEEITKLKGVGPYTAGAILSIAFNKPEPAVDGNVMRVLSRYFLISEDITKNKTRIAMEHLIRELIPHEAAGDFNEALMELGALVCTPKTPQCVTCPVMIHCAARLDGVALSLPIKKKSKPPRIEQRLVALIEGAGEQAGKILIRQRAQEGLLARMWELPHVEVYREENLDDIQNIAILEESLAEKDLHIIGREHFMDIAHIFSHIRWEMKVYLCKAGNHVEQGEPVQPIANIGLSDGDGGGDNDSTGPGEAETTTYRWISLDERDQYPFPNVFLRIMAQYEQGAWIYLDHS